MSASAILSIATAAAPLAGGVAATATTGTSADFEAILASEAATGITAAPSAITIKPVVTDSAAVEPSTKEPIILEPATAPTEAQTTAPVWFQVTSISLLPSLSVPPQPTEGDVTAATPSPVAALGPVVVTPQSASRIDAIDGKATAAPSSATITPAEPLETSPTDHVANVVSPPASVTTNALSTDQRTIVTAPLVPDASPVFDADTTAPQTVVARPIRSAESAALAQAALASLRQLPGAPALQQATVSQRKASGAATLPLEPVNTPALVTTVASLETDIALPAAVSASIPARGVGAGNAASASSLPNAGPTVALDTPQPAPDLKSAGPATVPTFGVANDDTLIAKPVTIVDTLPQPLDPIAETPVDPDVQVTATAAPTLSSSTAATPGIADASLSSLSRATIETTASLAAQITSRLAGRTTRFELGLTPEGLGRVDVTLDIDTDGQLSARLAFDNPLAATELRGRADELRRQLEDAGFTLARDALDFSNRDNPSGGERRQQRATAYADRHAASNDLIDIAPPAWTPSPSRLTPQGVDVKV